MRAEPSLGATERSRRHVVVVDDDEAVRESLTFLLETMDFEVAAFASPAALLESGVPATAGCLVLDVHMQPVDGIELLSALRAAGVRIPALMISGRCDAENLARIARTDARATLEKPFDDVRLAVEIERALAAA